MQLNPKTAAKQWLRMKKQKFPKVNPEAVNQQHGIFDKWATVRNRFFSGKMKIISMHKANEYALAAATRIEEEKKRQTFVGGQ